MADIAGLAVRASYSSKRRGSFIMRAVAGLG